MNINVMIARINLLYFERSLTNQSKNVQSATVMLKDLFPEELVLFYKARDFMKRTTKEKNHVVLMTILVKILKDVVKINLKFQ